MKVPTIAPADVPAFLSVNWPDAGRSTNVTTHLASICLLEKRPAPAEPGTCRPVLDLRRRRGVEGSGRLQCLWVELTSGSATDAGSIARTSQTERAADVGVLAAK